MNTTTKPLKTLADIVSVLADTSFLAKYPTQRELHEAAKTALIEHWKAETGLSTMGTFGRCVLDIMADQDEWDSDTTQAIADMAFKMKLWHQDSHDGSLIIAETLPALLNDRDQAMVVTALSYLRSDTNEHHDGIRRPGGRDAFTDEELESLHDRIKRCGMSLSDALQLDERELATVLAALSAVQLDALQLETRFPEHFEDVEALDNDEINALCERLNR